MEYIEGRNLREILKGYAKQDKFMPLPDAISSLKDIASALDYAHRQSIIHRDIKPSNIIVNTEGHAILTDFGLALNAIEGTIGNTFGSVHYIAPEQAISSAQAVPASDQYSLGIITYEMFTGRVPFDDNSAMSVALKHISDPPPPLRDVNPDIPPEVEQVVMRALDKDVHKRFTHCTEFVQALETAFTIADEKPTSVSSRAGAKPVPEVAAPLPPMKVVAEDAPTVKDTSSRPVNPMKQTMTEENKQKIVSPTPKPETASGGRTGWLVAAVLLLILIIGAVLLLPSFIQAPTNTSGTQTVEAQAVLALNQTETAAVLIAQAVEGTANARLTQTQTAQLAATGTAAAPTTTPETIVTSGADSTSIPTIEVTNTIAAQVVNTETPTTAPSNTPTEQPTQTPTTPAPTATPTTEPTATHTLPPTNTPTDAPTATPTIAPTPGLTMLNAADGQLLLVYNHDSIVVYNRDESATVPYVNLQFLLFEPNTAGEFRQTLTYVIIQQVSDTRGLAPRRCFQAWSTEFRFLPDDEPPADICQSRTAFAATVNTAWASDTPNAYFEVHWGRDDMLTTCPAALPDTDEPLRCVVDIR
jgi:hypothetical protein